MPDAVLAHTGRLTELGTGWVLVVGCGAAVLLYVRAARGYTGRRRRPWRRRRTAAFVTGAGLLALAALPLPGGAAPEHMLQHLLAGMYAPLCLVLGAPVTLLLASLPAGCARAVGALLRSRLCHVLCHPVTAAVVNVGGLCAIYLTPLYALAERSLLVHALVHLHLFLAGYVFAWSVAGPDPAARRPGLATRVAVVASVAAAHSWLAKLLYARGGALPPGAGLDPPEARQAAVWMYYGGDLAELALVAAVFTWWYHARARRSMTAPVYG